jgi:hypothetical protein
VVLILTRRLSPLVTRIRLNSQDLRRISLVTKGLNPTEFANIAGAENEVWWYRGIRRTLFGILDPLVKKRDLQTALEDGCGAGYDAAAFEQRSGQTIWLQRVIWFLVICAGLFLTRWKLTPAYLVTFDEINFALAVDQFDPALHQPQPPGYPLFVGLLKLLALALPNIETTFLMAALLVSAAALIFLWGLCEQMLGSELGLLGPLLLLFNPAFWLSSLINPARLTLAAGATAVAYCAWRACQRNSPRWLVLAATALGISAGFQPTLAVLLLPLWLWCAWRVRVPWTVATLALLCFGAAVCTWLPSLLSAAGGGRQFLDLLRSYSSEQFAGNSSLFGASLSNAMRMAWRALIWSCLGALSWIWLTPFVARRLSHRDNFTIRFLAVWFFPGLLFYAIFHVGDPDHTLSVIPATCAAGALILASLTRGAAAKRAALVSIGVLVNVLLFFLPVNRTARASTYVAVQILRDYIVPIREDVRRLSTSGPVTAVFHESTPGWRQLSYYEPRIPIIVVLERNSSPVMIRHITGRQAITQASSDGTVVLPSCGMLAWVDPQIRPVASDGAALRQIDSSVFSIPAAPNRSFEFDGFHFVSGSEVCNTGARAAVHSPYAR